MTKRISHPLFYSDLVYKLRRVKDTPNFISAGSKIVKRLRRRQYDPVIIERTIGRVLGPSTALYRPVLKHCTLTNKAVGDYIKGLVQTSSVARRSWSSFPLIVSRDSFSHQTWVRLSGVRRSKRPPPACHTRRKCSTGTAQNSVKGRVLYKVWSVGGCHWIWSGHRISFNICERETSYCLIRPPYRPWSVLNDDFKRSLTYPCSRSYVWNML